MNYSSVCQGSRGHARLVMLLTQKMDPVNSPSLVFLHCSLFCSHCRISSTQDPDLETQPTGTSHQKCNVSRLMMLIPIQKNFMSSQVVLYYYLNLLNWTRNWVHRSKYMGYPGQRHVKKSRWTRTHGENTYVCSKLVSTSTPSYSIIIYSEYSCTRRYIF